MARKCPPASKRVGYPNPIATSHFSLDEFSSPGVTDGQVDRSVRVPVPDEYRKNVERLMAELEIIRATLGGVPVRIISGWRSPQYNRLNKGRATRSLHLVGKAADIQVEGISPARVFWEIDELQAVGAIRKGGLAYYPTFVHYDIRGYNARWRRAPTRPACDED